MEVLAPSYYHNFLSLKSKIKIITRSDHVYCQFRFLRAFCDVCFASLSELMRAKSSEPGS